MGGNSLVFRFGQERAFFRPKGTLTDGTLEEFRNCPLRESLCSVAEVVTFEPSRSDETEQIGHTNSELLSSLFRCEKGGLKRRHTWAPPM